MKTCKKRIVISMVVLIGFGINSIAQNVDTAEWTLQKCINYALQENIQVRKSYLTNEINQTNNTQAKADLLPTVQASVGENFDWNKKVVNNNYGNFVGTNSTNYSVSSSVNLFNGFKSIYNIKQAELKTNAGNYDSEATKEDVSLSVLNAYLQVLYAEEQVKNSQKQVESSEEELRLASERLILGAISKSDYLQVKSALASEKLTLANAQSQLAISKVNLMQLLELPLDKNFSIINPNYDDKINQNRNPNADSIYIEALSIKPQVKSATLNKQSAELGVKIARADYYPQLSMSAGVSTQYMSNLPWGYGTQLDNKLHPSIGLTLSIPIFQKFQVKSRVAEAKINILNAELDEINTQNQLRKSIEQACVDASSAEKEFEAGKEQYNAAQESYQVASEKFNQGLINSVDFLIQKTNLISAESKYLQSKYKLIFSYKILDFYSGANLSL